jgi:hypothetical protein
MLLNNFWKKILAYFLAIVVWVLFTMTSASTVVEDTVNIQYKNIPENLILMQAPEKITYSVIANSRFTDVKPNIMVYVSLKDISPGWHVVPLRYQLDAPLPNYARIKFSSPSIRVFLDSKTFKNIPINISLEYYANKKSAYILSPIKMTPSSTLISGPTSIINDLKSIKTAPILVHEYGTYELKTKLLLPTLIASQESVTTVNFNVRPNIVTETLHFPIHIKNLPLSLTLQHINIDTIALKLSGLKPDIDSLKNNLETKVSVNLGQVKTPGHISKLPLTLDIDPNMVILAPKQLPLIDVTLIPNLHPSAVQEEKAIDKKEQSPKDTSTTKTHETPQEKESPTISSTADIVPAQENSLPEKTSTHETDQSAQEKKDAPPPPVEPKQSSSTEDSLKEESS